MRKLESYFVEQLKTGKYKNILDLIKADNTLDLEVRSNKVNIYYRGGNIALVNESGHICFDKKYLQGRKLKSKISISNFNEFIAEAKQYMDFWFTKNQRNEKEYQQLIVKENNYSNISNGTDYFIIDIEYDNHKNARFDLVGLEWESNAVKRKLQTGYLPKLCFFEMKYGDKAIGNKSGMNKHIYDFVDFVRDFDSYKKTESEMLNIFNLKVDLGLIPCLNKNKIKIKRLSDEIEYIFVIANHDPESKVLLNQLDEVDLNILKQSNIKLKFAVSNFFGYALYKENIYNYNDFRNKYMKQIYI